MGLDCSHGCWNGPYSAFMRFRKALVLAAWGIDIHSLPGFEITEDHEATAQWETYAHDPLTPLIHHDDSEGSIEVKHLRPLAARLDELADKLDSGAQPYVRGLKFSEAARQFARGCRKAALRRQKVLFR